MNSINQAETHLDNLSIGYLVGGILMAIFGLLPIIHLVVGLAIVFKQVPFPREVDGPAPAAFGLFFVFVALAFIAIAETVAVLILLASRSLKRRKNYRFVFVVACIACAFFPLGTILGVLTVILLSRTSVKERFDVLRGNGAL